MQTTLKEEIVRELESWDRRFDGAGTIADAILDLCAAEIGQIPTGVSLYQNSEAAQAATNLKNMAVELLSSDASRAE